MLNSKTKVKVTRQCSEGHSITRINQTDDINDAKQYIEIIK